MALVVLQYICYINPQLGSNGHVLIRQKNLFRIKPYFNNTVIKN